jgi:hypothetical protein
MSLIDDEDGLRSDSESVTDRVSLAVPRTAMPNPVSPALTKVHI